MILQVLLNLWSMAGKFFARDLPVIVVVQQFDSEQRENIVGKTSLHLVRRDLHAHVAGVRIVSEYRERVSEPDCQHTASLFLLLSLRMAPGSENNTKYIRRLPFP